MPPSGSVTPDLGSALLRLGTVAGVIGAALGALVLAARWMSGPPSAARRRARGPQVAATTCSGRRRGLLAAYDDLLAEAAVLLDVPHALRTVTPEGRELERIRLLGQLEAAGLVVSA